MPDSFWSNLPAIIGAVFAGIAMLASSINAILTRFHGKEIDKKLEENTQITIDAKNEASAAKKEASVNALEISNRASEVAEKTIKAISECTEKDCKLKDLIDSHTKDIELIKSRMSGIETTVKRIEEVNKQSVKKLDKSVSEILQAIRNK